MKDMTNPTEEMWMKDPRLRNMSPDNLRLLQTYAKELQTAPENRKMSTFLSINRSISEKNINFTAEERELLFAALTEGMTSEDKSRLKIIRSFMEKFQTPRTEEK